ncbi:MAG TPA: hypothetical protein VHF89_19620 [Solirubrobacteraceae bacterium]|nr:hypothetical protein [Solirubrobacteraceae bacterium]
MPRRLALLLLAIGSLAAAPTAGAAVVSVAPDGDLVIAAGPGERNAIDLGGTTAEVVVADAITPPTAGAGCRPLGDGRVGCTAPGSVPFLSLRIDLGDQDDRLVAAVARPAGYNGSDASYRVTAAGGADGVDMSGTSGYHRIEGGDGVDVLTGGAFDDELSGGADADRLAGLDGGDRLQGDGPGAAAADDALDGGNGTDVARYDERSGTVSVALASPSPQGAAGEADTFTSIEGAVGGAGDDELRGSAGGDTLGGGGGNDAIAGLDGDDFVDGDGGADTLHGGDGNDNLIAAARDRAFGAGGSDVLYASAGSRVSGGAGIDRITANGGRIACGSARDEVEVGRRPPLLARDCERALLGDLAELAVVLPLRRAGGRLLLRARCAGDEPAAFLCDGRALVRRGGRPLARGQYLTESGRTVTNRLRLTRAGRAARRGTRIRVTLRPEVPQASPRAFDTVL